MSMPTSCGNHDCVVLIVDQTNVRNKYVTVSVTLAANSGVEFKPFLLFLFEHKYRRYLKNVQWRLARVSSISYKKVRLLRFADVMARKEAW